MRVSKWASSSKWLTVNIQIFTANLGVNVLVHDYKPYITWHLAVVEDTVSEEDSQSCLHYQQSKIFTIKTLYPLEITAADLLSTNDFSDSGAQKKTVLVKQHTGELCPPPSFPQMSETHNHYEIIMWHKFIVLYSHLVSVLHY